MKKQSRPLGDLQSKYHDENEEKEENFSKKKFSIVETRTLSALSAPQLVKIPVGLPMNERKS